MSTLPYQNFFFEKQISLRSSKKFNNIKELILAIPGGPWISGQYLDNFMINLKKEIGNKWDVAVLDLPNHGKSKLNCQKSELNFIKIIKIFEMFMSSLELERLIIVGHSFGSIITLKILSSQQYPQSLEKLILISTPESLIQSTIYCEKKKYIFKNNSQKELHSNLDYQEYWKQILPLYFSNDIRPDWKETLLNDIQWVENKTYLEKLNDLLKLFKQCHATAKNINMPLFFLQGDNDIVLNNNNFNKLNDLFPNSTFKLIKNTGHFPTIEDEKNTIKDVCRFIV